MLVLGIDDAGRGPVIGPMVIAGCLMTEEIEKELKEIGVKDSKQLTQKRREFLAEKIKEKAMAFEVIVIHASDIDKQHAEGINLNRIEAIASSNIINKINKGFDKIKVIIDCPSPTISKWQDFVKTKTKELSNLDISCEHKADKNHPCVSAASILAKCTREIEMDKLKEKYGKEIGSGYPADPLTCRFLAKYAEKYKEDGLFRQTWSTWKKACENIEQRKLV